MNILPSLLYGTSFAKISLLLRKCKTGTNIIYNGDGIVELIFEEIKKSANRCRNLPFIINFYLDYLYFFRIYICL